ncbi:MAG: hypothetical protein Q7K40_01745 [bacterium]|nr:hypothetical protein [bacterium]
MLIAGKIFDYSLMLSISNTFVNQPFIDTLWTIVRDFSNMIFIFILIYAGVQTILSLGDWKKTIKMVVIMALLINFSLFFTKVVIDAGNVLAVGVYESLGENPAQGKQREISGTLVASFQPQNFISRASEHVAGESVIVFAVAIAVGLSVAWVFFSIALVFFGRLLAFWFLMIISPFAFISLALPKGNIFDWWTDTLLKQAFVAPVFLFLMYIIMKVVEAKPLQSFLDTSIASTSGAISDSILAPVFIAALLVVALLKTKDFTTTMAGEFGAGGAKLVGGVMGAAAGAASFAGTGAVRALSAVGAKYGGTGGALGAIGDASAKIGHAGRNVNFDVRNIPIPIVGGTVGSHTGTGAGRAATFVTNRAEAVKRSEEKAKRKEEKPQSVEQAVAKAGVEREKKKQREEEQKASLTSTQAVGAPGAPGFKPATVGLKDELRNLEGSHAALELSNAASPLQRKFDVAKDAFEVAELALQGNPSDQNLQNNLIMTRNTMRISEKELKDFKENPDKIEKLKDKIEKYEAL